jgi:hypothetical protein
MDEADRIAAFYKKHNVKPPEHINHGFKIDDIKSVLKELRPNEWRLEGNTLIGKTEMGEIRQTIPTDYICTGTDDGLPILQKVKLS